MGFMQDVKAELLADYTGKSVTVKLGALGSLEFERSAFLHLWDMQDRIGEIVNKSFTERLVMHGDMTKEQPEYCIASLNAAADVLDGKRSELRGQLAPPDRQILTALEDLRSACILCAKKIRNTGSEMDAGNVREYESDCKVRSADWLPEIIQQLRIATYPVFWLLIDLLADGKTRQNAEKAWFGGLDALPNRERFAMQPSAKIRP